MPRKFNLKNQLSNYGNWVIIWTALVIVYPASIHYGVSENTWDKIICFLQLSIDICIGTYSYLAFKNKSSPVVRKFYLLIAVSMIPGLFANEVYNILINIIGLKEVNKKISILWTIAYTAFLCLQISAWLYLYFNKNRKNERNNLITLISYTQPATIVLLSFVSIAVFRKTIFAEIGLVGVMNSLLETLLFIAISMSLARTKSRSVIYLEIGFLLLMAFNLAHRLSYSTGHSYKAFDILWWLSLITIIFGLIKSYKENKDVEFFKPDSLHVHTSAIFLAFATVLLVGFIIIDLMISSISMTSVGYSNILPQNIPSMLIFSYTLAFLVSKLVASHLARPLDKISKRIDHLYECKITANHLMSKKFNIHEIDYLDKFILKTVNDLQKANKIKSDFLMNMSHDFRTPASGITLLSRSIYKKMENSALKKLQKLVVDSSEHLMKFLDDVLDYSRLDSDQAKLHICEIDLKALVKEIVSFVEPKINDKNLYIKTDFVNTAMLYTGDRLMLHRIILNLVTNAIKFTNKGGITIILTDVKDVNQSSLIQVKIQDTGIGIEEKFFDFIFEPFNRINPSTDSSNAGIGLGLSNVSLMLKKMNGKIHVQSELGKGSEFVISLPM